MGAAPSEHEIEARADTQTRRRARRGCRDRGRRRAGLSDGLRRGLQRQRDAREQVSARVLEGAADRMRRPPSAAISSAPVWRVVCEPLVPVHPAFEPASQPAISMNASAATPMLALAVATRPPVAMESSTPTARSGATTGARVCTVAARVVVVAAAAVVVAVMAVVVAVAVVAAGGAGTRGGCRVGERLLDIGNGARRLGHQQQPASIGTTSSCAPPTARRSGHPAGPRRARSRHRSG